MKKVSLEILAVVAIVNPARDECVHALEIVLVKLGEAGWVALRGLDQTAFLADLAALQSSLRYHHSPLTT
jgi:hypothetical protein